MPQNLFRITRFVAYLPADRRGVQEELPPAKAASARLNLTPMAQGDYLFAGSGPVGSIAHSQPESLLLDVFHGTAVGPRLDAARFDADNWKGLHYQAEQSAQCYNLIRLTDTEFTLESDALGVKPVYVAVTPHGQILGSRIADLLVLFPALAKPADRVGLYELMCFWTPLAGRTLHDKIRRTVPGGRYHWHRDRGFTAGRHRALEPVSVEPMRFVDETVEAIHSAADQSLRDKTRGVPQPLMMAHSGGFDSRYIAGLLRDNRMDVRAFNFGLRHNEEWHSARAVARALAMTLERVPYPPDNTLTQLPAYLDATEGTADPAAASIMPLLDIRCAPGTPLLHGFCGDLLAGSHIHRFSSRDYASHGALADAVLRHYFVSTRPELRDVFQGGVDEEAVRADMLAGLRDACPPHEAYLLWYLENRNRRYVGAQFALLGERFDTVMPLYERRLFQLWHAVPPVGLNGRVVFRHMLARYYPTLARIAHPQEAAAITPNLRQQLGRLTRQLPRLLLEKTAGRARAKDILLRLHRHDDIMMLTKLAAPRQQAHMLRRIDELRPALADVLDIELTPGYETLLTSHQPALRNLFYAGEYAQRLRNGS